MLDKKLLQELYLEKKLSAAEIAKQLGVGFPKALYWIKKHGIPIRSVSDRTYVKLNPNGDPFHEKTALSPTEKEFFGLALGLYWAEGSRKNPHAIQLANLDHRMLRIFVKFLREIVQIEESRLRLSVRVYSSFSLPAAHRYWTRLLKLKPNQVHVYPHTDTRSVQQDQWSRHGIATIQFCSTTLKRWFDDQLEEFIERFSDRQSYTKSRGRQGRSDRVRESAPTYTYA